MGETMQPQKKRKGCLIPSIIMVALIFGIGFGIYQVASNPEKYGGKPAITLSPKDQQAAWLEFDTKTWEDFKNLYTSHNNLIKAMEAFSNSDISAVDLYDKCTEAEEYFRKASLAFDYGTTDDEKTYLKAFRSAALSDQMIAKALKTYVDSNKTSDLATVNGEIKNATTAYTTIASNRGTLLVKAGLTDEEIKEKVEADMAELESLSATAVKPSAEIKVEPESKSVTEISKPTLSEPELSASKVDASISFSTNAAVFLDWVPYDTGDPATLAKVLASGDVIFRDGQYWASPEYANMLANEEVVYFNDTSPDDSQTNRYDFAEVEIPNSD